MAKNKDDLIKIVGPENVRSRSAVHLGGPSRVKLVGQDEEAGRWGIHLDTHPVRLVSGDLHPCLC